jgi:hypothetical protein
MTTRTQDAFETVLFDSLLSGGYLDFTICGSGRSGVW